MVSKSEKRPLSGEAMEFPEIEPWPEPVSGADLLRDLVERVQRHAVLSEHEACAIALYVIHTHLIDSANVSPLLALLSPEKRCGKTTVLGLISRVAYRPVPCSNISDAMLYRAVAAWRPTLLIDEADTFLRESKAMRGILNSGHTRDTAYVIRGVGDNWDVRRFSTWGPKVIAMIGKLPDTLQDRAIVINLRRKLPHETREKLRQTDATELEMLRRRCAGFARDNANAVQSARPDVPDTLHDRAADNWEPLLAIADQAGGEWPVKARAAAVALSGETSEQDDSRCVCLLGDIRDVFASKEVDRLASADLIGALVEMEDRPWSEYGPAKYGHKALSPSQLARLLARFGIAPKDIRFGEHNLKGYMLEQFEDAFARYLTPQQARHRYNQASARDSEASVSATDDPLSRNQKSPEAASTAGCSVVADEEVEVGVSATASADGSATEVM